MQFWFGRFECDQFVRKGFAATWKNQAWADLRQRLEDEPALQEPGMRNSETVRSEGGLPEIEKVEIDRAGGIRWPVKGPSHFPFDGLRAGEKFFRWPLEFHDNDRVVEVWSICSAAHRSGFENRSLGKRGQMQQIHGRLNIFQTVSKIAPQTDRAFGGNGI